MTDQFEHIKHVYLVGIGGIGMSALARYFQDHGKVVSGYDRVRNNQVIQLEDIGIPVTLVNEVDTIPVQVKEAEKSDCLVIYTAAIKPGHVQLDWFIENNFNLKKRAEVLGMISSGYNLIAVGGTHGKTTTSCMIAHLLSCSKLPFMAILGGVSTDLGSNFYTQGKNPEWMVTEADEFDGSFQHLNPYYTVLTSVDADHLDFYQTDARIKEAFDGFAASTRQEGIAIIQADIDLPSLTGKNVISYGIDHGHAYASNIKTSGRRFTFDYSNGDLTLPEIELGIGGLHNIENAVAAITVAIKLGMDPEDIKKALASFQGVKRRFEYIIERDDLVFIDDYAHHPTELSATIKSVKQLYPDKKITGVFQPHLYTRTRDFADGFAKSLDLLDTAYLMPIYPAREEPIEGVTSEMIAEKMEHKATIVGKDTLVSIITQNRPEVLLTLGAGDIDQWVQPLKSGLE